MSKLSTEDKSLLQKVLDKISAFGNKIGANMITITTADGAILDFGDQAQTVEEIAVGMTATIDGSAATGSHVMPDGRTFVFDDAGALTEITEAAVENELEAANARIAELEAQIETAQASNTEAATQMKTLRKEFEVLKTSVVSDIGTVSKGEPGNEDEPVKGRFLNINKIKENLQKV